MTEIGGVGCENRSNNWTHSISGIWIIWSGCASFSFQCGGLHFGCFVICIVLCEAFQAFSVATCTFFTCLNENHPSILQAWIKSWISDNIRNLLSSTFQGMGFQSIFNFQFLIYCGCWRLAGSAGIFNILCEHAHKHILSFWRNLAALRLHLPVSCRASEAPDE